MYTADLGERIAYRNGSQSRRITIDELPSLSVGARFSRLYSFYVADETSGEESESESSPRTWEQREVNDENDYAPSSSGENATTEDAIAQPTRARAATPSSDRESRPSLESVLEAERDFVNREDRISSTEDHLPPPVPSFNKEGTLTQSQEAPFAETEHQQHQKHQQHPQLHPQESYRFEPLPSAVRVGHAGAARGKRPKRRRYKSTVGVTSDGEAREQHQPDMSIEARKQHQPNGVSVASEHSMGDNETELRVNETAAKHKGSIGKFPPEGERWHRHASSASVRAHREHRHASSASLHHHREHRHHHHHKDHHKDHHHHNDHKVQCVAAINMPVV